MISNQLLKQVRFIEVTTKKIVDDLFAGQYKSHFRGQGVQFSEHRIYVPGDDVRHINWTVSARTKEPLVKKFDEERQLTVFLVVDVSASQKFGTATKLKSEMTAEIAALIAYAASKVGDKVGALLFAEKVEKVILPKVGKNHFLKLILDLLSFQPETCQTNLQYALEFAEKTMKQKGILFVLSDFIHAGSYEAILKRLAKKHDVVAIHLCDERERVFPSLGRVLLFDPESALHSGVVVDTSSYSFQKWFDEMQGKLSLEAKGLFEVLKIFTKDDYVQVLSQFFYARAKKKYYKRR